MHECVGDVPDQEEIRSFDVAMTDALRVQIYDRLQCIGCSLVPPWVYLGLGGSVYCLEYLIVGLGI